MYNETLRQSPYRYHAGYSVKTKASPPHPSPIVKYSPAHYDGLKVLDLRQSFVKAGKSSSRCF